MLHQITRIPRCFAWFQLWGLAFRLPGERALAMSYPNVTAINGLKDTSIYDIYIYRERERVSDTLGLSVQVLEYRIFSLRIQASEKFEGCRGCGVGSFAAF